MIKATLEGKGEVLQSQLFASLQGVEHYCSMRETNDPEAGVWMPHQVHGTQIVVADEMEAAVDGDAVISTRKGQWVGVRTADCVPVLLYDPTHGVVAAVHAGWRGTVKHIVRLTVEKMVSELSCSPESMLAMVGPSISPEAFEVGEEVAEAFVEAGRRECVLRQIWGPRGAQPLAKPHVDLWQSNVMDLLEAGLELQNIDCTPWCTFEHWKLLFSARREGIGTGRIVSAIRLK